MPLLKSQVFSKKAVLALFLGLSAALLVSIWSGLWKNGLKGPQIIVAIRDIGAGTQIQKADLKLISWAHAPVPLESFKDFSELANRVSRQKIVMGEPILESKLAAIGSKAGLSATITPGKRAITVRVNDVIGVAGFALPGSYVDILVSVKQGNAESYTKTVLKNIKVLAVAQDSGVDNVKPKIVNAVTFELTPEEAETLDRARTVGTLSLTLKNEADALTEQSSVAPDRLLTTPKKPDSKVNGFDGGSSNTIEVIRGMRKDN